MKTITLFIVAFAMPKFFVAQVLDFEQRLYLGVSVGYNQNKMHEISSTLIPVGLYSGYCTADFPRDYGSIGITLNGAPKSFPVNFLGGVAWRFPILGKSHQLHRKDFEYQDDLGLNYTIKFNFHYLEVPIIIQLPLYAGDKFYFVPQAGFIGSFVLNPTNIEYTSNDTSKPGIDLQVRDNLRSVLKGKNTVNPTFGLGLGYHAIGDKSKKEGLRIVLTGLYNPYSTDALETLANSYNFVDNKNARRGWQVNIAFEFRLLGE